MNYYLIINAKNIEKMETKKEIAAQIVKMLQDEFVTGEITPDCHLANDLGLDSLETFDFAVELEKKFNISLEEKEITRMKGLTIEQIAERIHSKQV